ncbi:MAG: hypothetical protein AAGF12_14140 [Myxococcota bacterium]
MNMPQPPGAPGHAFPPATPPPQKKSNTTKWLLGCGGGCLFVLISCCGTGAYFGYLEEGRDMSEPQEEVAEVPWTPGVPTTVSYTWTGNGYAHHDIWLDVTGTEVTGQFRLEGTATCDSSFGGSYQDNVNIEIDEPWSVRRLERQSGGAFTAWFQLRSEYDRSRPTPVTCTIAVHAVEGTATSGRIVVTRMQRPSDWLSGL